MILSFQWLYYTVTCATNRLIRAFTVIVNIFWLGFCANWIGFAVNSDVFDADVKNLQSLKALLVSLK